MSEFTPEELESAYRDAVGRPGLLPCPFCGSDDIVEVERKDTPGNSDKAGPIHGVYGCRSCLAIGPNTMEQWNTRPQGWISRKNLLPTEEGPRPRLDTRLWDHERVRVGHLVFTLDQAVLVRQQEHQPLAAPVGAADHAMNRPNIPRHKRRSINRYDRELAAVWLRGWKNFEANMDFFARDLYCLDKQANEIRKDRL